MSYENDPFRAERGSDPDHADLPQVLNVLSSIALGALIAVSGLYEADASHRFRVITGAGNKAFAAGAN